MFFKRNIARIFLHILLGMICVSVYAQSPAQLLSEHFAALHTFQADFVQTVNDKNGNVLQQSQGKTALVRPGLFRWETLSPNQQLIVADGKNIWIDDKDLAQVRKQKQQSASHTPGLLLSEPVNQIVSQFVITNIKDNIFKLVPKGQKDLFQFVTLTFQGQDLKSMTIQDSLGQITSIQFSHGRVNQNLSKNLFQFNPPKNADVFEN